LLDDAAAQVGVYLPFFRALYSVHEHRVAYLFLSSKALKPPRLEDSRAAGTGVPHLTIL